MLSVAQRGVKGFPRVAGSGVQCANVASGARLLRCIKFDVFRVSAYPNAKKYR